MKTRFAIPLFLMLTLTTFTNCSPYTQSDNSSLDGLGALSCPNTSNKCVTPTYDNLSITANLPLNASTYQLAGQSDFNIAGDCNEGGYPANMVSWELYEGATKVRDSNSLGFGASCINGRFQMYVTLASVGTDPVNRTNGFNSSGVKTLYSLVYRLRGFGPTGYADHPNAMKSISLLPPSP